MIQKIHAEKCRAGICHSGGHAPMRCHCLCTCDGYHTFDELYDHRITLFIALCKQIHHDPQYQRGHEVWRSKHHSDGELCFGTGTQFVMGIFKEKGKQITYHVPIERWDETDFAPTLDLAPEWDGHSSDDVLTRLKSM